jgi:hypothetical protein
MIEGDWSSGMIPASGAGGREFDSRITPFFFFLSGAGSLEAWRFVTNTNYSPPHSPLAPLPHLSSLSCHRIDFVGFGPLLYQLVLPGMTSEYPATKKRTSCGVRTHASFETGA